MFFRERASKPYYKFKVGDYIPHADKMRVIDGTADVSPERLKLSLRLPSESIYMAPNKEVTPLILIEMLAQLFGAQYTYEEIAEDEEPIRGYLVGLDKVRFSGSLQAEDQLDLYGIDILMDFEDIKRVKGEVHKDGVKIAYGDLTLYKTEEWLDIPARTGKEKVPPPVSKNEQIRRIWSNRDALASGIAGSFNRINRNQEGRMQAMLHVPPDFIGFSGHFPGYPILPAVGMLYIGWLLAELAEDRRMDFRGIRRAKFIKPIHPFDRVNVNLRPSRLDEKDESLVWYLVELEGGGDPAARYEIGLSAHETKN